MIRVVTDHPVAITSNDHLYPRGTKNDNSGNLAFNECVRCLFGENASILDLGCSGGAMVHSFVKQGHFAVGIEGSNYSQRIKRAEWEHLDGTHLFTADITKMFMVVEDDGGRFFPKPLKFDVVTMWEVLEHIAEEDLPQLFNNISLHLKPGGVAIMSVCPNPDRAYDNEPSIMADAWEKIKYSPQDVIDWFNKASAEIKMQKVIDYHQCCHDQVWWETKLATLRWFNNQGLVRTFGDCMVRGGDNAPGSFHMVLERG